MKTTVLLTIISVVTALSQPTFPIPTCENVPESDLLFDYNLAKSSKKIEKANLPCVPVYVETDLYTLNAFSGDVNLCREWIDSVFANVERIYANEGITIYVSDVYIPTTASWSDTLGSVRDILHKYAEVRQDAPIGRLKHFMTMRPIGGGISWVNALCVDYFFIDVSPTERWHIGPFSVSAFLNKTVVPYPDYSWNVEVVAHELGHNLGSKHTHACVWGNSNLAIDDCYPPEGSCGTIDPPDPGTVMSYCHLSTGIDFNKGFGELPGNLIRSTIDGASCLVRDNLNLSGNLTGFYIADSIFVNNGILQDCHFDANCVEIINSDIISNFTVNNDNCGN